MTKYFWYDDNDGDTVAIIYVKRDDGDIAVKLKKWTKSKISACYSY